MWLACCQVSWRRGLVVNGFAWWSQSPRFETSRALNYFSTEQRFLGEKERQLQIKDKLFERLNNYWAFFFVIARAWIWTEDLSQTVRPLGYRVSLSRNSYQNMWPLCAAIIFQGGNWCQLSKAILNHFLPALVWFSIFQLHPGGSLHWIRLPWLN